MPRNLEALVNITIKATCFTTKFLQKKYEDIPAPVSLHSLAAATKCGYEDDSENKQAEGIVTPKKAKNEVNEDKGGGNMP